jgi:hypothetical protein
MSAKLLAVPKMAGTVEFEPKSAPAIEIIDSPELARRLGLPESWVRNHTRARTPAADRIPVLTFGRYKRFSWGSPELAGWLESRKAR